MLTINRAHAFSPGSDLWIVPATAAQNPLVRRIDWYLNFQLSRARHRRAKELPHEIKKIMAENQMIELLSDSEKDRDISPLAVIASDRLPTNVVVELPEARLRDWVQNAHSIWEGLGKPRIRLFLSAEIDPATLATHWPSSTSDEFSIVSL